MAERIAAKEQVLTAILVGTMHLKKRVGENHGSSSAGIAANVGVWRLCSLFGIRNWTPSKKANGATAPDAANLAEQLCAHFKIDLTTRDLAKVAEIVEIRKGRAALETFLKKVLANVEPDEDLQWLTSFRWRAIFTTNYDRGIERAYDLNPNCPQAPISMSLTADLEYTDHESMFRFFTCTESFSVPLLPMSS